MAIEQPDLFSQANAAANIEPIDGVTDVIASQNADSRYEALRNPHLITDDKLLEMMNVADPSQEEKVQLKEFWSTAPEEEKTLLSQRMQQLRQAEWDKKFGKKDTVHPTRVPKVETTAPMRPSRKHTQLEIEIDQAANSDIPLDEHTTEGRPIPNSEDVPTYDYDQNVRTNNAQISDPQADGRR